MHKKWVLELKDLDVNAQITHIRKILRDLGMKGNKMSISQAENIRNRRELADELGNVTYPFPREDRENANELLLAPDDVQRFGKAIVSGKPFQSKSPTKKGGEEDDDDSDEESGSYSDREQPVVVSELGKLLFQSGSDRARTTRAKASWPSLRTRAPTTTD